MGNERANAHAHIYIRAWLRAPMRGFGWLWTVPAALEALRARLDRQPQERPQPRFHPELCANAQGLSQLFQGRGTARASDSIAVCAAPCLIQRGTRVLISLWDSLMFGRVPKNAAALLGTRPNISESHREISTRVPFCIVMGGALAHPCTRHRR